MSDVDRFLALVAAPDANGCEMWTGARRDGYGRFTVGSRADGTRRQVSAHGWLWEHLYGPVPDGLVLRHECDNRACVRHLILGTQAENVHDMIARGRAGWMRQRARAA